MMKAHFPRTRIRFIAQKNNSQAELEEQGARPFYVDALDNVPLALYKYFPKEEPESIIIFYHDAGLYQCPQYHDMALELARQYHVGVYLAEIRGHGFSGSKADHLGSGEILLDDIEQLVRWCACKHIRSRIFLGAHSQTCSLITHYGALRHPAPLSGFVMIAPYFGPFATPTYFNLKPQAIKTPLNHLSLTAWMMHYLSKGLWWKNQPIWQFDPSPLIDVRDPKRVSRYKSEMARFMNVIRPKEQLSQMGVPFFALLPGRDDRFELKRLIKDLEHAAKKFPQTNLQQAFHTDFISILQGAPAFIARNMQAK